MSAWRFIFFNRLITLIVVFNSILFPCVGLAQNQGLEKFRLDNESIAKQKKTEVADFARINKIPITYNSTDGTHFSLVEIRKGKPIYRMT